MCRKRQLVIGLLLPLVLLEVSCHKKQTAQKAKLPGPAQAPTLTQTLPDEIPQQPLPEAPAETASAPPADIKPKPKPRHTAKRTTASATTGAQAKGNESTNSASSPGGSETASLRPSGNPADSAAAIAVGPDVSSPEANRDRQSTKQLLDSTENQLKRLDTRSLTADQKAMLSQIRAYIGQSRKAITDGDYERASNLARKAQLLTDELMKQ
jgi:hypothetical protein